MLLGGVVAILLLSVLWEWALFKRVLDNPLTGKLAAVGAAWLTAGSLAGFGMADGGPFYWAAYLIYLPSAAVVVLFAFFRRNHLRR